MEPGIESERSVRIGPTLVCVTLEGVRGAVLRMM
jgi:hypothetical protein